MFNFSFLFDSKCTLTESFYLRVSRRKIGKPKTWDELDLYARTAEKKRDVALDELIRVIKHRNFDRHVTQDGLKSIDFVTKRDDVMCTVFYKARNVQTGVQLFDHMRFFDVVERYNRGNSTVNHSYSVPSKYQIFC